MDINCLVISIEMNACDGAGLALANAEERLKSATDYVMTDPREGGVFEALIRRCGIAPEGEARDG